MESFLPSEIARLVLGYLEDQKCEEAYSTFLKTSLHLDECLKMKEVGRKFRTQVLGLSLLDILYEYSAIYSLVQERLKKVDPEAVERLRHSGTLLDKITFLLNSTSSGQTMLFSISLPPGNSPQTSTVAHAHVRKRLRTSSSNDKRKDTSRKNCKPNDTNETSMVEASSNNHNLETTNLSSLPGNSHQNINLIGQENEILRTPKRKLQGNNKRQSRANSVVPEELDENFDITALTQALLDNHELHEKIAENINKVICTPENNSNVSMGQDTCSAQNPTPETNTSMQPSNNFTMELDNVIKKIVHDTESDPIFENFLHEVVGPSEETSDDYDDRGISNTSTPSKSGSETGKKQNIKNRNRSGKLKRANSTENIANTIDDHNAVAIESIISINAPEVARSETIKNNENIPTTTVSTINSTKTSNVTDTAAIVSESALNNSSSLPTISNQILTVDTTNAPNIEEQNVLGNQNKNLLMVGQQQQQQPHTFVIADPFPTIYQQPTMMPDNRIIFLSNKPSTIASQYLTMPPTFQITQPAGVISDNDILNMPTVFISDDPKSTSGYIISQPAPAKPSTTRKRKQKPKTRTTPRKILQKMDSSASTNELETSTTTKETETVKYTISIQAEPKQSTDTSEEPVPSTSGLINAEKKDVTPEKTKSASSSKVQLSLSSPRSNKSHIRALDFSTPPKEDQSPNKSSSSPKLIQKGNKTHKSPKNIKKPGSAVFISPVKSIKVPIATKSPKVKLKGDWNEDLIAPNKQQKKSSKLRTSCSETDMHTSVECDADNYKLCDCVAKPTVKKLMSWDHALRSLIVPVPSTSQQKKTPGKKRTRSSQRNKDKKPSANTTETEVMCIEAELAKMSETDPETQPTKETEQSKEQETVTEDSDTKATKPEKKKKQNSKSKSVVQKVETTLTTPEKIKETDKPEESNNTSNQDLNKSLPTESLRNMTPKIRKKCNTSSSSSSSSSKKTPTNSEENKSKTECDTSEVKETTVVSPPKMDKKHESQQENEFLAPPKEISKSLLSILTPNLLKATCSNEVTAKRNLIPVLETPMKDESLLLPITPRLFTPFNLDSPITRLLGEKLDTGDLAPFLSPSFPMTPSFPITPNLQSGDTQSSYASRPTDYSNSSSYYQPSDSEQNQKLEQVLIDEAMKIETSDLKTKHLKTSTPCKTTIDSTEPVPIANSEIGVTAKLRLSGSLLNDSINTSTDTSSTSSSNTSSSSSSMNNTKENINKDDANVTVIHTVPDSATQMSNNEQVPSRIIINKELRVNLIKSPIIKKRIEDNISQNQIPKEPIKKLRGRPKSPVKRLTEKAAKPKRPPGRPRRDATQKNTKKDDAEEIAEKPREIKSKVTGSHATLLKELEEKRKRIMTELKVTNKPTTSKTRKKNINETVKDKRVTRASVNKSESNAKPETKKKLPIKLANKVLEPPIIPRKQKSTPKTSIESVAKVLKDKNCDDKVDNVAVTNIEVNQSLPSPIYSVGSPNISVSTIGQDDGLISYTPDEEIPRLHISSDEEDSLNKSKTNEKIIDDSDLLVKELKERGIYLIPNKEKKTEELAKEKQNEELNNLHKVKDNETENTEQLNIKENKIEIMSDIHLDKSKIIDVSKIEFSQGIVTDVISRTTIKNNAPSQENILPNKEESKDTVNNSDSTLDVSESSDYEFHVKVINESSPEFINFTYDETSKPQKKISDYNFTVLERNISAKIYIEEIDKWEDKTFTVTPYIDIYTRTPKRKPKAVPTIKTDNSAVNNKNKKIVNKPNPPSETILKPLETKTYLKPLEILYNECVDESSTDTIITIKESASKTNLIKSCNSNNENDKKEKQLSKDSVTSSKSGFKKTISLEQYKINKNKDSTQNKIVQKPTDEIDMERVEVIETSVDDDDLMNYVVTNKDPNNQELNTRKRKTTAEETMKQNAEKRVKPNHALLKSIDVDSFLTKVHGPSEKS